jgi:polygalacturonase
MTFARFLPAPARSCALLAALLSISMGAIALRAETVAASPSQSSVVLAPVALPSIPARQVDLVSYGAVGNGTKLNTMAFAAAIAAVADQGGGRVNVPSGIWLTGPIIMRSRVELHLDSGAIILFTPDRSRYPLVETSWEGNSAVRCLSPISGANLEDIAITGEGVIDGSGDAWRPVKKDKLTEAQWRKLLSSGGVTDDAKRLWFPSASARLGYENSALRTSSNKADLEKARDALRPVLLNFVNCRRVLLEGVTFQNSPAWCLHPLLSEDLTLRRLTVRNPWYAQNGDGLDIESCRRVLVEQCNFDVGDDAICIKSGKDAEGRKRGRPTESVLVRDCVVQHGHGGFVIGSEMSGGVRDVVVERCTFLGTDVGLRFKSTRGRGGLVERIRISDIRMLRIGGDAILFDLFYMGRKAEGAEVIPPVSPETPSFRDIRMTRIVSVGARRSALIQGLPEMPIQDVVLEDSSLEGFQGISVVDTKGLLLRRVEVRTEEGPALSFDNSSASRAEDLQLGVPKGSAAVAVSGARSAELVLEGREFTQEGAVSLSKEVPASAVTRKP